VVSAAGFPSRARVAIRPPEKSDQAEFLACVRRSARLHRPWVSAPATPAAFRRYVERMRSERSAAFLVCLRSTGEIVGVVNVSEIVLGNFRSAYLGYYGFTPHAGRGYMTEGLALVIRWVFRVLRLHRVEANIQPGNRASIALARRLGFRKEGLSPRYLKIGGRWRDHERLALLAEEW
jgi:ribosomal-protein-alanine N-acetyltransferase